MSLLDHRSSRSSALCPDEPEGDELALAAASDGPADSIEVLLLSVGRGDHEAFVALQDRIAGLVRVNVGRVLRDASRSEAVTQKTFAGVLEHAASFDPHLGDAQTWLLLRAHRQAIDELASPGVDAHRPIGVAPTKRRSLLAGWI